MQLIFPCHCGSKFRKSLLDMLFTSKVEFIWWMLWLYLYRLALLSIYVSWLVYLRLLMDLYNKQLFPSQFTIPYHLKASIIILSMFLLTCLPSLSLAHILTFFFIFSWSDKKITFTVFTSHFLKIFQKDSFPIYHFSNH